jgi:eukaryotic-like serine/threonine-protein kinase
MSNLIGKYLDRYHIIEPLGEGGMATVYKAYDTRLETDVAVKVIRTEALPQNAIERALKRFEREAKSLAKLTHPNIVKVTDYGEYEGMPYLVMPYLPGGTLKKLLGKPMPWRDVVKVLIPVAEALDFAHRQGVVHRDVKPANILLTELGQPMLTDFGIAKILDAENTMELTGTGAFVGTPEYMAPEQATAKTADHRADIYSLGIVLYEMVTGRKPYQADTPFAVMIKQANDPLPRPSLFNPDIPKGVENILLKALTKKPEDRYQSMGEMVTALEGVIAAKGRSPKKIKEPKIPKVPAQGRPFNWKVVTGVIVFLLATLGLVAVWQSRNIMTQLFPVNTSASSRTPMLTLASAVANTIQPTDTSKPTSTPYTGGLSVEITDPKGVTMRLVSAGEFTIGAQSGSIDAQPAHTVTLDPYYMDVFEVTNALYKACVDAGSCKPPQSTGSSTRSSYYDNHRYDKYPVVYVDWYQAKDYCEWRGARLPTEAEWEKAARGTDGRIYPWGDSDPSRGLLNYKGDMGDTIEVGSYAKGRSLYGIYDMSGNVSEWVNDWYNPAYYQNSPSKNPQGPASGISRVLRGGSWNDTFKTLSTNRDSLTPTGSYYTFGFRCASSNPPSTTSESSSPDAKPASTIVAPVSMLGTGETLLEEDFESGQARGFTPENGKWSIVDDGTGNKVLNGDATNASWSYNRFYPEFFDGIIQYKVRFVEHDPRDTSSGIVFLIIRENWPDGMYQYNINIYDKSANFIGAMGDGPWVTIKGENNSYRYNFQKNKWYSVRLEIDGENLRAYIDDKLVSSVQDDRLKVGMLSLGIAPNTIVQFDDIKVASFSSK